jgi:hypothetical protein
MSPTAGPALGKEPATPVQLPIIPATPAWFNRKPHLAACHPHILKKFAKTGLDAQPHIAYNQPK